MPKPKSLLPPPISGTCPNPRCSKKRRTYQNLNKHFIQTDDCLAYLHELRRKYIAKTTAIESAGPTAFICPPVAASTPTEGDDTMLEPDDDPFPYYPPDDGNDDQFPANLPHPPGPMATDFEQAQYMQFTSPHDNADLLVNPDTAVFTNARRVEVTLLKILTELEAPLWAFKDIMAWARDAAQSGYKFMPQQDSYRAQLETISRWVGMAHLQPKVVEVALPGARLDDSISVTTFDFVSQLHSLLSDHVLNNNSNLVINADDPFSCYYPPDGRLGESLSGSWYRTAWDHMTTTTNCNFMIPVILYIDKTQMSISGKLSLFPVQMSLSIFTEETRRKSRAWRPLGYIANEDYYFSSAERDVNKPDVKNERFHAQLHEILRSYRKAQEPNALADIPIQLGTHSKRVNLYVPLQFIIGDVEGGDQLCSRQSYRGNACKRLCRTCDVSTENAARTDLTCTRIRVAEVQSLVANGDLEALKNLHQRPGFNALYSIDCGGDPYGVFSMIHTEGLHAIEVGLIPYMLEILYQELPNTQKHQLDGLVKRFGKHPKQHGYAAFPRLLWQDGVTTITNMTGDLKVGKMFAIVAVALTLEGEQFFTQNLPGGAATWQRMVYVFQQILCYWTWLKQDRFWMTTDETACEAATRSIKIMMDQLQALWPRRDGLEWNLTKLHEQFHVPRDIHRTGRHKNVHTGPQEHNHIDIKRAALKTQMNKKKLDFQTGQRVMERIFIQRAYDFVKSEATDTPPVPSPGKAISMASKGTYRFVMPVGTNTDHVTAQFSWQKKKYDGLFPLHHEHIMRLLMLQFFQTYAPLAQIGEGQRILEIQFFTEYERNGFVYRAHPNYRGEGAYYDWVDIQWEIGAHPTTGIPIFQNYIGRILGFITHPGNADMYAIVHSTMDERNPNIDHRHGVFGHYWHLEFEGNGHAHRPLLQLAPVASLLEHVCMIPYTETDPFMWVHIYHPSTWPSCFQTILPPGQEGNIVQTL